MLLYSYLGKSDNIKRKLFGKIDALIHEIWLNFNSFLANFRTSHRINLLKQKLRDSSFKNLVLQLKKGIQNNDPQELSQILEQINIYLQ